MYKSYLLTLILFLITTSLLLLTVNKINDYKAIKPFKDKYLLKQINTDDGVLGLETPVNTVSLFNTLVEDIKKEPGNYSIYIKNLNDSKIYTFNQDNKYYAASLFKLPVGVAVLKNIQDGNLSLDTQLVYLPKHYTDGTGYINQSPYGTLYTVDDLLSALYKDSDNVAQNILLDYLNINTKNVPNSFPNNGKTAYYNLNITNTKEVSEYIDYIFNSDYLNQENRQYLLSVMNNTSFDYLLANNLSIPYSHKIGISGGNIHDCGITTDRKVIICIMSENTSPTNFIQVGKLIASFVSEL